MTKFFVDATGKYLGGFSAGSSLIPDGAIEVEAAPNHADEIWQGGEWVLPESRLAMNQILELEAQVTPRRLREAALGTDGGWLANIEQQIAALREQL